MICVTVYDSLRESPPPDSTGANLGTGDRMSRLTTAHSCRIAATLVAACVVWGAGARANDAGPVGDLREPTLRLPPTQSAPTLDGRIGRDEWAGA